MLAATEGFIDIVRDLLVQRALDLAKEKNHNEIVDLLSKGPINKRYEMIEKEVKESLINKSKQLEQEIGLLKDTISKLNDKENEDQKLIEKLKEENETLKQKSSRFEQENYLLKEQITKLNNKEKEAQKVVERSVEGKETIELKKFLLALKEKIADLSSKMVDLDDYDVESVIGESSLSCVKLVTKKEKFAMKELLKFDYKTVQRFIQESEILIQLRHPCVIHIYGVNLGGTTASVANAPFLILAYEPTSLESAIHEKILEPRLKCRIAVEIVLGMRYIHSHNYMHRDLKPSNILLSKNMHVRISDFGLAKDESLDESQSKGVGTLRFMAPELLENENESCTENHYNNKVDVYSFGITLIYIVTGSYPPFNLMNVVNNVPPNLPETMAKWVHDLIVSCLAASPESRPSFAEIFEIFKDNNYDLFDQSKGKKLTSKQLGLKQEIEERILKIEAFEYQHQDDQI